MNQPPIQFKQYFSVDFEFTEEEILYSLPNPLPEPTEEWKESLRQMVFDQDQEWIKEYMEGVPKNARP